MPLAMSINSDVGQARGMLTDIKDRATNLMPVKRDFAAYMEGSIEDNFKAGGRPRRWKPSRRALATAGKTLIKTGRLKNSITGKVSGKHVLIGTNVAYAKAHQFGSNQVVTQRVKSHARKTKSGRTAILKAHTRRRRMNLPARPFLKLQRKDRAYLNRSILKHFSTARGQVRKFGR
jgi:phage gpG-like protein